MILLEKKLDIFNKIIYTNKKQDYEKRLLDVKNSNQNELKNYEQKLIDEYNINFLGQIILINSYHSLIND